MGTHAHGLPASFDWGDPGAPVPAGGARQTVSHSVGTSLGNGRCSTEHLGFLVRSGWLDRHVGYGGQRDLAGCQLVPASSSKVKPSSVSSTLRDCSGLGIATPRERRGRSGARSGVGCNPCRGPVYGSYPQDIDGPKAGIENRLLEKTTRCSTAHCQPSSTTFAI